MFFVDLKFDTSRNSRDLNAYNLYIFEGTQVECDELHRQRDTRTVSNNISTSCAVVPTLADAAEYVTRIVTASHMLIAETDPGFTSGGTSYRLVRHSDKPSGFCEWKRLSSRNPSGVWIAT